MDAYDKWAKTCYQQAQATVEQRTQATVEIKFNRIWGGVRQLLFVLIDRRQKDTIGSVKSGVFGSLKNETLAGG